eukprot:Tamp_23831.p2 GENE.Tamp_23831~~Tamp_23831.p2  ORF type:complete len:150 (+),score=31.00 Tamp_23831:1-450(+)
MGAGGGSSWGLLGLLMLGVHGAAAFTAPATFMPIQRTHSLAVASSATGRRFVLAPLRMGISEEEYKQLMMEGRVAPEGSEAREKWLAAVKQKQQEDFDRSMKQDFYKPEFKQWKDENPQLWKAAQLLWITLVIGSAVFPGFFTSMFGGQ